MSSSLSNRDIIEYDELSDNFNTEVDVGNVDVTLTADQVFQGILYSAPSIAITLTFPSAADLVKANDKTKVAGYGRHLYIRNDGSALITVAAGTGGAISGTASAAASAYASHFYIRFANVGAGVESYQIIRI